MSFGFWNFDHLISIHAPREGCDAHPVPGEYRHPGISIHAPREGCDESWDALVRQFPEFQSTHPARGATAKDLQARVTEIFQSTHPARGATL